MSEYYFRSENLSLPYRYVRPEADGAVYLMYAASESLYGESTAVTNIHSINTSTGENTLLAYNVSEYTLRIWVKNGTLRAVHTGTKALISFDNVVALLEGTGKSPFPAA